MGKKFGFFILDEQSCTDKKGLIEFLADKIFNKMKCINCGNFLNKIFKKKTQKISKLSKPSKCT